MVSFFQLHGGDAGQGRHHLTGDGVHQVAALAHQMALQNAEEIEDRDVFQIGLRSKIHVMLGHVRRRQHAVEGAVLPGDGNGRGRLIL